MKVNKFTTAVALGIFQSMGSGNTPGIIGNTSIKRAVKAPKPTGFPSTQNLIAGGTPTGTPDGVPKMPGTTPPIMGAPVSMPSPELTPIRTGDINLPPAGGLGVPAITPESNIPAPIAAAPAPAAPAPVPPQITTPVTGSLPAQVADAMQAQSELLVNPGGGVSNPFVQMAMGGVGGMNQLDPASAMLQNQLFGQAFNTGGNETILQALEATNVSPTNAPFSQDYLTNLFQGDVMSQPGMQGSLDAISRMVNRQLEEQTMPGIQDAAIGAGQMGSSRQGVAEGIARRGAQETIADATARTTLEAAQQQQVQQQQVMNQLMGLSGQQSLQSGNILSSAFGTGLGAAGSALAGQQQANITQGATAGSLGGGAFNTQVQAQLQALGLAPQTGDFGMAPSRLTGAVGDAQQQYQQQLIDEALQRFYQTQGADSAQLQQLLTNLGIMSPMAGGQTTTTGPATSTAGSALGGAAAGAALGTQIMPGMGTGIGAGIGGLVGAFG